MKKKLFEEQPRTGAGVACDATGGTFRRPNFIAVGMLGNYVRLSAAACRLRDSSRSVRHA